MFYTGKVLSSMDDLVGGETGSRVKLLHTHVTCKLSLQNDFFTEA